MLSRNPKDYYIVTKKTELTFHGEPDKEATKEIENMFLEEPQGQHTTFWVIAKDFSYHRRYSIDSCPKWLKRAFKTITGE